MPLSTIRLNLARSEEFPNGDDRHGYEFRAPLDDAGKLDQFSWASDKDFCTVRKYEHGVESEEGLLQYTRGGKWVFSYKRGTDDDEPIFRLSSHVFVPGQYVSITEHDGVQRAFRVASVEPWHPTASAQVKAARWPSK